MPIVPVKKHAGNLPSASGQPISYDLYVPFNEHGALHTLVFLHGKEFFKDWGTFPDAFIEMAERGYAVVAYDHAQGSFDQQLEDLSTVLDAIQRNEIGASAGLVSMYPVGVVAHADGARTALVSATTRDDIQSVVCLSATATDDAMEAVTQLYIPCCFIHGMGDEVASYRDSDKLYQACVSREKDRILLEKASHTFGASHPYTSEQLPSDFEDVMDHTLRWFQSTLM